MFRHKNTVKQAPKGSAIRTPIISRRLFKMAQKVIVERYYRSGSETTFQKPWLKQNLNLVY